MATRAFLLCGDEKAVHAVTQILDELDVSFEHSGEPPFALKRLAAQRFDLLIVDCDNAQNATQVFNSARASNLNKNSIAVAVVEGKAGVPNAFRLGASLVLTKPVSLEQARNTLRTGIGMTKKDAVETKPAATAPVATPTPAPLTPTPMTSVPVTPVAAAPTAQIPAPTLTPAATALVTPHPVAPAPVPPAPVAKAPLVPAVPLTPVATSAPVQAKPAASASVDKPVLVPKAPSPTPAAAQEHKPALTDPRDSKVQPTVGVTAVAKAATVGTSTTVPLPVSTSKFDSVFVGTASTVTETDKKIGGEDKDKSLDLSDAKEPVLRIEDPLAEEAEALDPLKDHGVPSFGAMGRQSFAGFDEEKPKRSKAPLMAALVLIVIGGGAYAAWATQPNFRAFMAWEYGDIHSKIDAMRGKAPVTAAVKPQPAPAPPAPVQPVTPPVPQNAENIDLAATSGATASAPADTGAATSATANAAAPAATNPVAAPSTSTEAAPAKPATLQSVKQDATPGHSASLVPASLPPSTVAKAPARDLFEVPEDFADDQVVHRVHPMYPKQAIAKKLHGSVVLQAIISKQGKVDSLQLVSGDPILAQAAAAAVKQWRYKPYWHNNEPTDFQTRVTVDFKLP
jgi:periplasmic protein TonB